MAQQPNFILIYPDSMGANSLGCYGNRFAKTPNMDRLASEGVRFSCCTSSNPVCMPSRASLHTGCYVSGHNVRNNSTEFLSGAYPSLAQSLRTGGYLTAYYGKTHSLNQQEWDDVFDLYPDYNHYLAARGIDVVYPEKPPVEQLCSGVSAIASEDFSENILGNIGQRYLRAMAGKDRPFFLFMSHEAPHSPWTVPPEDHDLYTNADILLPDVPDDDLADRLLEQAAYLQKRASLATDESLRYAIRIYMTLLHIVDRNLGRLIKTLEETGQADNTIVVVMADHGDHLGNHRSMGKGLSLDESLIHVPLIFYAPVRWRPHVNNALVQNIDLFPTVLDLAGLDFVPGIQGQSLRPLLEQRTDRLRDYAFSEEHHDEYDGRFSVRDARYKLVFTESGFEELYDLKSDPLEWRNLANRDDLRKKKAELKDALLRWRFQCLNRKTPQKGSWETDFMQPGSHLY